MSTTWAASLALVAAAISLASCANLTRPISDGFELTCDGGRLRIAWSMPARLASVELIRPDGIPLMTEELEVPPGNPVDRFENAYEWIRNDITPPGDYQVRLVVDGQRSDHAVTCP